MAAEHQGFVEIASVLVNPEIFTRPYACDVEKYGCNSTCCYRSCIVSEEEAAKVEQYLDGILEYLAPENRDAVRRNGGILAQCDAQCPAGCVIHEDEARAISRQFGGKPFRCVLLFNNDCALLYTNPQGVRYCSVHSFAVAQGFDWQAFKFTDCVQYPLSFYVNDEGKRVLSIQDTPYLRHVRCMTEPSGEPMYKSLRKTIEKYLGKEFYQELAAVAERVLVPVSG